ncbi:MAG: 23S rRNA (adenine(2503)-C(2))-methyltransferase RlmN [Oscillospiraceae bacterium]|nr:23S rRNA (adenine(2503)-C(2))-methyltransferase RlmN [Oscillospiraceae bacterium]
MQDIKSLTITELSDKLAELGQPKYRASQVFRWLSRGARGFDDMSDLPKKLRDDLASAFSLTPPVMAQSRTSSDGTVKYLWKLADGETVESVVMEYKHGTTVCVSSQVGCRMGCKFCASTIGGLVRNLTAGEILDQVIFSGTEAQKQISSVVLMGIGEPLDNFDNVLRFLRIVSSPEGYNLGMRHITVSTCGNPESIDKLAGYNLQLTLTISLHAPDDETRSELMPVNRTSGVAAVMDAAKRYFDNTGRRVSLEYALIDGVNDGEEKANALAGLLRGAPYHVNLIRLNEVPERGLAPSGNGAVLKFTNALAARGVNFTIRRRLGLDIDAACGQLRRRSKDKESGTMPYFGLTDRGKVRRTNQDVFGAKTLPGVTLLAVCDGMGGASAGEVASALALKTFLESAETKLSNAVVTAADVSAEFSRAVHIAGNAVLEEASGNAEQAGMGTTLVAAGVIEDSGEVVACNIGDSRAYKSAPSGITKITRDHSVVGEMVERGALTPEQARRHPRRNLITKALGTLQDEEPDIFNVSLDPGEYLLLCSDGLTGTATDEEIWLTVKAASGCEEAANELMQMALRRGAPDNVTVLLFQRGEVSYNG